MERPKWRALYEERPKELDFWTCHRCGLELDRRSDWQMLEVLPNHIEKHNNQTK